MFLSHLAPQKFWPPCQTYSSTCLLLFVTDNNIKKSYNKTANNVTDVDITLYFMTDVELLSLTTESGVLYSPIITLH